MFTLAQLTGFVAVAEALHFGRAAERLHMTQPPLTRQIQALERELGVELFDRSRRAISLTPAGRAFVADARQLLRDAETATLAAKRVAQGEAGTLALGFTAGGAQVVLGPLLAALGRGLPSIDVVLREAVTGSQLDAISAGTLDVGFMRPPAAQTGLARLEVHREGLVAAVPAAHRLAASGAVRPPDLVGEAFVMYSPRESRYFHELVVSALGAEGVAVRYVHHVSQIYTVMALVSAGIGCALVPESAARAGYRGVVFRKFQPAHPRPVLLYAVWRQANPNPALHAALELVAALSLNTID